MDRQNIRNLQIISSPGVGGRELIPPLLAHQLSALGHPTWLMARPGTLIERTGNDMGLNVLTTRMQGYFDPGPILALAAFLKREKIQVIHAHWSRDLSNCITASGLAGGIPVVLTKHVYATQPKLDPFHTWVYKHTNAVIAVSRVVEENIKQTVRIRPDKVVTIYNGLDLDHHWNFARVRNADLRTEFGIPQAARVLGFVGRMNSGKGPHLVMEAFSALSKQLPAWHLVLAGKAVGEQEEHYLAELKATVCRNQLESRVHFINYRSDMPEVMRTFDILACPSVFESFGMVVIEAMAMECAVVGSDSGGIPEIIEPGVNGELFRAGDASQLTERLGKLMRQTAYRKKLGITGRKTVSERFSLDYSARRVAGLYQTLVNG
jgi:glycosyltransferase involved in cell wall biosynthesis